MRFIRRRQKNSATLAETRSASPSTVPTVRQLEALLREIPRLARSHWIFAIAEISKGLALVTIGDMVVADELGGLIGTTAENLRSLGEFERLLYVLGGASNLPVAGVVAYIARRDDDAAPTCEDRQIEANLLPPIDGPLVNFG